MGILKFVPDKINQANREWMKRPGGPVVRILSVSRYDEYGNERYFVYRLAVNDSRKRGRHLSGMIPASIVQYEGFPFGQWVEVIYEPALEAA